MLLAPLPLLCELGCAEVGLAGWGVAGGVWGGEAGLCEAVPPGLEPADADGLPEGARGLMEGAP